MTDARAPEHRLAAALRIYAEHPLDDGDGVLLLDDQVCLEMEGLADSWSLVRSSTVHVLRSTATRVTVAIARPGGVLRESDRQLWRDLHADLRDTPVHLQPLLALPAA